MLEWLKTPAGAYNFTFIVAIIAWIIAGVGVFGSFHLNKVRTIEAQQKAKRAEADRDSMAAQLAFTSAELERTKTQTAELASKAAPRTITPQQRALFIQAAASQPKGLVVLNPLSGQAEPAQYAAAIADMLNAAGYTTEVLGMMPMGAVVGMGLTVRPGEDYPPHTDGLISAFAAAGIRMDKARNALQRDGVLAISIGTKP